MLRADLNVLSFIMDCDAEMQNNIIGDLVDEQPINMRYWGNRKQKEQRIRGKSFFEETIPGFTSDQFKEHFRMSRTTFEALVLIVARARGEPEPIAKICLPKKLLFTIWILSKQESFLSVGERFNIAKSSGHQIFQYIVKILSRLMSKYIKWQSASQQTATANIFQQKSRGFPGVIGAIDACHICIKQMTVANATDYCNRKEEQSVILQGVCDSKGRFINVNIGQPGGMHDARVLRLSPLYARMRHKTDPLIPRQMHLLGDSAYPLSLNLMTPYRDNGHLTAAEIRYNVRLSTIRTVIERTFGLLKGNFGRLKLLDVQTPEAATCIISACCMLHNFILINNDAEDSADEEEATGEAEESEMYAVDHPSPSSEAMRKRDAIKVIL